jgi:hypothetical protein
MSQVILAFTVVLISQAILAYHQHLTKQLKQLNKNNSLLEEKACKEYNLRIAYQRGLGLPLTSQEECIKDLWSRANQGDQTAEYILMELMSIEIEKPSEHKLKA